MPRLTSASRCEFKRSMQSYTYSRGHCHERRMCIHYLPEQKAIIWDRYKYRWFPAWHHKNVRQISFLYYAHYSPDWWISPYCAKATPAGSFTWWKRGNIQKAGRKISIRGIADRLLRASPTINHGINRHGCAKHCRASKADKDACDRALRQNPAS